MNQAPKSGSHDTRGIEPSPAILRPYHRSSRSDQRNGGLWPSRMYSHRCHLTKTESNCGRPDRCEQQSPYEGSRASIEQAGADGDANAFPGGEERQAKGHSRLHGNERLEGSQKLSASFVQTPDTLIQMLPPRNCIRFIHRRRHWVTALRVFMDG